MTRDAFFEYLRERRPELIERYERMFSRGRFASRKDVDRIDGVAARASSAVQLRRIVRSRAMNPACSRHSSEGAAAFARTIQPRGPER